MKALIVRGGEIVHYAIMLILFVIIMVTLTFSVFNDVDYRLFKKNSKKEEKLWIILGFQ